MLEIYKPIETNDPFTSLPEEYKNIASGHIEVLDTVINPVYDQMLFKPKHRKKTKATNRRKGKTKTRAEPFGDPSTDNYKGPWAKPVKLKGKFANRKITEQEKLIYEEQMKKTDEDDDTKKNFKEQVEFHLTRRRDSLQRSWIIPPTDLKQKEHKCWYPKKLAHTWNGHTRGVSKISLFPTTGHLLLSGSFDQSIKIWDVSNKFGRKCIQTYVGHSKGVKDVCFNYNGRHFLSCSYDKKIKLWDTETGQVIQTFSTKKTPLCINFHPSPRENEQFITGCSDKTILQFDAASGKMVQKYDYHLGAVNTVTFIGKSGKFISTSDDKTLRIWDFGISVPVKYISDPEMQSMPSVAVHPSTHYIACQSMDNQVLVYETRKFKLLGKKKFKGHLTSGFACQVNFSPDGQFVISGDTDGKLYIWDWETTKIFKTLKAHDKVLIGCEWHPIEPSKVVTCSWDSNIKYWD
eukprot:Anaeramoba_ignava/a347445_97.p2 GENE.a347445_97~~a347445_97.p2  ORF type:complete len:462 (+),score=106.28 a347445_97:1410-2795(+)